MKNLQYKTHYFNVRQGATLVDHQGSKSSKANREQKLEQREFGA